MEFDPALVEMLDTIDANWRSKFPYEEAIEIYGVRAQLEYHELTRDAVEELDFSDSLYFEEFDFNWDE